MTTLLLCGGAAVVASAAGTGVSMRVARLVGAMDLPGAAKIHARAVPRLGGLGLVGAMATAITIAWVQGAWSGAMGVAYLLGAGLVAGTGIVDDLRGVRPVIKLTVTALGGAILSVELAQGSGLDRLLSHVAVVGLVVACCHGMNFIDGLDGLAAGVAGIAVLGLLLTIPGAGLAPTLVIVAGLLGGVVGFLPWNWHPARTFMGDGGSLFLGFTVATLLSVEPLRERQWTVLLGGFVVVGIPLGDLALTMLRRLMHRRPLFQADPLHFYNVLMRSGLSHRGTVLVVYALAGALAGVGYVVSRVAVAEGLLVVVLTATGLVLAAWRAGMLADREVPAACHLRGAVDRLAVVRSHREED